MSNFIKDDSPLWQQIVKIAGFVLFTFLVFAFGVFDLFGHDPKWVESTIYPGVKEYSTHLYWRFHPLMWYDVLGLVFYEAGLILISGIWSLALGQKYVNKPNSYAWGGFAIAVIGVILFIINPSSL